MQRYGYETHQIGPAESCPDDYIPVLGTRIGFDESTAALCVPLELRRWFRSLDRIDPLLGPKNAKTLCDFFSRCRVFSKTDTENSDLTHTHRALQDWQRVGSRLVHEHMGLEETFDRCIMWTGKDKNVPNKNMYYWLNGKNILVRRIMFEWFVGPTKLSEDERTAFQKRRNRTRKKPRRIGCACAFPQCINPWHLIANPGLPKKVSVLVEHEKSGVSRETVEYALSDALRIEGKENQGDSSPHIRFCYDEGESSTEAEACLSEPDWERPAYTFAFKEMGQESPRHALDEYEEEKARKALLGANRYSVSILLRHREPHSESLKRKRSNPLFAGLFEEQKRLKLPRLSSRTFYSICGDPESPIPW